MEQIRCVTVSFCSSSSPVILFPESSGFLVSGRWPGETWGDRKNVIFLIGCLLTAHCIKFMNRE